MNLIVRESHLRPLLIFNYLLESVFSIHVQNENGLLNVFHRLDIKLLSSMLNAWDCHCSGGEYKAPQGKPYNHKSFVKANYFKGNQ